MPLILSSGSEPQPGSQSVTEEEQRDTSGGQQDPRMQVHVSCCVAGGHDETPRPPVSAEGHDETPRPPVSVGGHDETPRPPESVEGHNETPRPPVFVEGHDETPRNHHHSSWRLLDGTAAAGQGLVT